MKGWWVIICDCSHTVIYMSNMYSIYVYTAVCGACAGWWVQRPLLALILRVWRYSRLYIDVGKSLSEDIDSLPQSLVILQTMVNFQRAIATLKTAREVTREVGEAIGAVITAL